jgi:hypothetical protein
MTVNRSHEEPQPRYLTGALETERIEEGLLTAPLTPALRAVSPEADRDDAHKPRRVPKIWPDPVTCGNV